VSAGAVGWWCPPLPWDHPQLVALTAVDPVPWATGEDSKASVGLFCVCLKGGRWGEGRGGVRGLGRMGWGSIASTGTG
jgi:hypothetical protein